MQLLFTCVLADSHTGGPLLFNSKMFFHGFNKVDVNSRKIINKFPTQVCLYRYCQG